MTLQLRALAVLLEDSSFIPIMQMVFYNYLKCQSQGIRCCLLAPVGTRHLSGAQTYMQAQCSCI